MAKARARMVQYRWVQMHLQAKAVGQEKDSNCFYLAGLRWDCDPGTVINDPAVFRIFSFIFGSFVATCQVNRTVLPS